MWVVRVFFWLYLLTVPSTFLLSCWCCLQIEETYVELLLSLGIRPLVVELRSTAWTSTDDGLYNFRSSYEYFTFLAIYYSQIITRVSYKPNSDFTYNWFIDSETRTRTSLLGSPVLCLRMHLLYDWIAVDRLVMIKSSELEIYCPLSDHSRSGRSWKRITAKTHTAAKYRSEAVKMNSQKCPLLGIPEKHNSK